MIHMNLHSMESVIEKDGKAFEKMTKLKTLIIENGQFFKGLKYLRSSLRVLKWRECLSESLSSSIFGEASDITCFSNCIYIYIYKFTMILFVSVNKINHYESIIVFDF